MRYSVIALLLLAGCVNTEAAKAKREQAEIAECTKLGFKPDTEKFAECRLSLRSIAASQAGAAAAAYGASQQTYHNINNAVTRPFNGYR